MNNLISDIVQFAFNLVAGFNQPKENDGWRLVSDSEAKEGDFVPQLVEFIQEGDVIRPGNESPLDRVGQSDCDCGGQRHAEAMLRNQERIPEEWRSYVLVFPGTKWRGHHPGYNNYTAFLAWQSGKWNLYFSYRICFDYYKKCRGILVANKNKTD